MNAAQGCPPAPAPPEPVPSPGAAAAGACCKNGFPPGGGPKAAAPGLAYCLRPMPCSTCAQPSGWAPDPEPPPLPPALLLAAGGTAPPNRPGVPPPAAGCPPKLKEPAEVADAPEPGLVPDCCTPSALARPAAARLLADGDLRGEGPLGARASARPGTNEGLLPAGASPPSPASVSMLALASARRCRGWALASSSSNAPAPRGPAGRGSTGLLGCTPQKYPGGGAAQDLGQQRGTALPAGGGRVQAPTSDGTSLALLLHLVLLVRPVLAALRSAWRHRSCSGVPGHGFMGCDPALLRWTVRLRRGGVAGHTSTTRVSPRGAAAAAGAGSGRSTRFYSRSARRRSQGLLPGCTSHVA